jgi:uncharacterized integral membrane protein
MADDPAGQKPADWPEFRDGKSLEGPQRDIGPRVVVAMMALVAAVIFVVQNRNRVETKFLFIEGNPRLWVVIVVSLALGVILGQAGALFIRRRRSPDKANKRFWQRQPRQGSG